MPRVPARRRNLLRRVQRLPRSGPARRHAYAAGAQLLRGLPSRASELSGMGLARDLVELEARLRDHADVDLFAPVERGRLLASPECARILGRIRSTDPASVMRLCLQALRI